MNGPVQFVSALAPVITVSDKATTLPYFLASSHADVPDAGPISL